MKNNLFKIFISFFTKNVSNIFSLLLFQILLDVIGSNNNNKNKYVVISGHTFGLYYFFLRVYM